MASAGPRGTAVALPRPLSRAASGESSDAGTAAWVWALPCALVTIALVAWLAPPLSHVLYPGRPLPVLPTVEANPEPVEDTRYLLALLAPVLLAGALVLAAPRVRISQRAGAALALAAQALGLAVVVVCFVRQFGPSWRIEFFTLAQVVGAGVLAVALAAAARRGWLTGWRAEPRWLTLAVPLLALLVTGIWFLSYLNTDQTICTYGDCYNTAFMADETFAVLNGLTPLVDHVAAYGSLWPFVLAPVMALAGKTLFVWSVLMWALTVAMLLALYGVLRRVTRSSLAALALFLPLMTFVYYGASRDLHNPIQIYQQVPMRTAGPFLLAWLVARRLDRGAGAIWPLGLAAGLVALNNADFGLAALGATVAALLWSDPPRTRAALGRLAGQLGLGLAGAYALVAVVTLVRAGALPDPAKAVAFARIYTRAGVGVWPLLRLLGLPLAIYLTYVGAIGLATVRALRGARDRTLTGMLAWSGIFGLGSGAYYMGASTILAIATLFPGWGLCLALLAVAAVRQLALGVADPATSPAEPGPPAGSRRRLAGLPALAALFGFALTATFLAMPPARLLPWQQVERLEARPYYAPPDAEPLARPAEAAFRTFVASTPDAHGRFTIRHGAPVAFFTATGHLLADAYGIRDVVPYTGRSVFTERQFDDALDALRRAGGSTALVPAMIVPRIQHLLVQRGFRVLTSRGYRAGVPGASVPAETLVTRSAGVYPSELTKWVDGRVLRGPAQ